MQASGQTEAEIRAVKENRQVLAAAAKAPCLDGSTDRRKLRLNRWARTIAKIESIPIWEAQVKALAALRRQEQQEPWRRW